MFTCILNPPLMHWKCMFRNKTLRKHSQWPGMKVALMMRLTFFDSFHFEKNGYNTNCHYRLNKSVQLCVITHSSAKKG